MKDVEFVQARLGGTGSDVHLEIETTDGKDSSLALDLLQAGYLRDRLDVVLKKAKVRQ